MALVKYPVFVVHYTPLKERKVLLSEQLKREGLFERTHWIENFDRESITEWPEFELPDQELNKGIIAVNMAHVDALERIARAPEGYGLVLEDDVVFVDGAVQKIAEYSKKLPEDWDMLFIGKGGGFRIPLWRRRLGKHIYLKENTKTWWGGRWGYSLRRFLFCFTQRCLSVIRHGAFKAPF